MWKEKKCMYYSLVHYIYDYTDDCSIQYLKPITPKVSSGVTYEWYYFTCSRKDCGRYRVNTCTFFILLFLNFYEFILEITTQ